MMKLSHTLPRLAAVTCLACAIGSLVAVPPKNEPTPQRRTITHDGEELEVTEYPDGTTGVSLEGLPMHFSVSQVSPDGSVEIKCVKAKTEDLETLVRPNQPPTAITR